MLFLAMRKKRQLYNMSKSDDKGLGFLEVTSIGVGGMVGGGIFAVLGLSVTLAQGGAPVAFLIAGIVALATSYSYARLSVKFPSQGGTVSFLDRAFGPGVLTGGLNILLWISYIVMLSLYAYAFGSYGASLFPLESQPMWKHIFISGIIIVITILNLLSTKLVGEAEDWIVIIKLIILVLFLVMGIPGIEIQRLMPETWSSPMALVAGGMIIFLAYEGFELIANTAQEVRNPEKMLPLAYFSSVGFVIVIYVLIAAVTVGTLSVAEIINAKDYALAEAAKPFLGPKGFTLITIAALLSTTSAINATVYGAARLSYMIAKDGELPEILEKKAWGKPIEGLLITSGATLFIANMADLSSMSVMGSAGFLIIFSTVNGANAKMAKDTKSSRWLSLIGTGLCLLAFMSLVWQTLKTSANQIWILISMIGSAFIIEFAFRLFKKRTLRLPKLDP